MHAKYVPVAVAGLVGLALSVTRHAVPLTIANGPTPAPGWLTFLTHASNVVGFLLSFLVVLGVAYWAGGRLDLRREYGWLVGSRYSPRPSASWVVFSCSSTPRCP